MAAQPNHDPARTQEQKAPAKVMSHRDFSSYMTGLDSVQRRVAIGRMLTLGKTLQGIRERLQAEGKPV